jgi:hypothetical protein
MRAKEQDVIKGIYYNELTMHTFFVNSVENDSVRVSTVLTEKNGDCVALVKVLSDERVIPLDTFLKFKFSGNYSRDMINK